MAQHGPDHGLAVNIRAVPGPGAHGRGWGPLRGHPSYGRRAPRTGAQTPVARDVIGTCAVRHPDLHTRWIARSSTAPAAPPKDVPPGIYLITRWGSVLAVYPPGPWDMDRIERDLLTFEAQDCCDLSQAP